MQSLLLLLLLRSFLRLYQFYLNKAFLRPIYQNQKINFYENQEDDHQDSLTFFRLQFYEQNFLNIIPETSCSHKKA